ncbi:MAG: septum formation initiator family protein [Chloroflexota bacterium]|nr:septum formation initiator family protein [Chloroflexota bacterium]
MQVLLLLVLTVAIYFVTAFASELLEGRRIARQIATLNEDINRLSAQNKQLHAAVAQAKTDALVERQARDKLGLMRAGDIPVIVVNAPAEPGSPPPPPSPQLDHWQKWAALFQPGSKL